MFWPIGNGFTEWNMRSAILILPKGGGKLPSADQLGKAGFCISTAVGTGEASGAEHGEEAWQKDGPPPADTNRQEAGKNGSGYTTSS